MDKLTDKEKARLKAKIERTNKRADANTKPIKKHKTLVSQIASSKSY